MADLPQEKLHLRFVTPAKTLFEQSVDQVIIPTEMGQITVLPHHAPLVSILEPGELIVKSEDTEYPVAVTGGVIEVFQNELVILADAAEQPSDIDIEAAEKRAEELAKELEEQEVMDITTYTMLQKQMAQEQARLQVGKKWRKLQ